MVSFSRCNILKLAVFIIIFLSNITAKGAAAVPSIRYAGSDEELRSMLHEEYEKFRIMREDGICDFLLIVIDVDDTIILDGSDFSSMKRYGDFRGMKVLIPLTIEELNEINSQNEWLGESENPTVRSVAVTSAKAWKGQVIQKDGPEKLVSILPAEFELASGEITTYSRVRSEAMASIGLPLYKDPARPVQKLPIVTKKVSFTEMHTIKPTPLTLEHVAFDGTILRSQIFSPQNMELADSIDEIEVFLLEQESNEYMEISAMPVCQNGVASSNFVIFNNSRQKGLVVKSLLESIFGPDPTTRPRIYVIALDNDPDMLAHIARCCMESNINFSGLIPTFARQAVVLPTPPNRTRRHFQIREDNHHYSMMKAVSGFDMPMIPRQAIFSSSKQPTTAGSFLGFTKTVTENEEEDSSGYYDEHDETPPIDSTKSHHPQEEEKGMTRSFVIDLAKSGKSSD